MANLKTIAASAAAYRAHAAALLARLTARQTRLATVRGVVV